MFNPFKIAVTATLTVNIPALDRFVTYLEAAQQTEIDDATRRVTGVTGGLQDHRTTLETTIEQEKT